MRNDQPLKICPRCQKESQIWFTHSKNIEHLIEGKRFLIHHVVSVCESCGFETLTPEQLNHLAQALRELNQERYSNSNPAS